MEINYQLTIRDFETFVFQLMENDDHPRLKRIKEYKTIFPLLIIFVGFTNIIREYFYYNQDKLEIRPFLYILIFAAALYFMGLFFEKGIPLIKRRRTQKYISNLYINKGVDESLVEIHGEVPLELSIIISANKLQQIMGERVDEYSEPFIKDLYETGDYLICNGVDDSGILIPKRAFQSEEEQAQFKELLDKLIIKE